MEEERMRKLIKKANEKENWKNTSPYPTKPLEKFRVMLFGDNFYIYDFNKYVLVKDENGNYMKAHHLNWDAKRSLYDHYHKLVREDREIQLQKIQKRKEDEERRLKANG